MASPKNAPTAKAESADGPPDLIGRKIGNYRIISILGRGTMGIVYRAEDEALLRPTAIKILSWKNRTEGNEDPVKWFLSEARSVAALNHPGIVQVYGVGRFGDYYLIAMEFVDGPSVDKLLETQGAMSPRRATEILIEAAEALHAAHLGHVVHRDVKPANLLTFQNGRVKLSDFGLALTRLGPQTQGQRIGTPYYTAPELWRGMPATAASDIYSLGATYYHLLTGRHLFDAANIHELEKKHLNDAVPDPRKINADIPEGCAEIVRMCAAKHAQGRYTSAQEVAWAASMLLGHLETARAAEPTTGFQGLLGAQGFSPESDTVRGSMAKPRDQFQSFFNFRNQPFSAFDPLNPPYVGEPFESLARELEQRLEAPGGIVLLSGQLASGRTSLAYRQLLSMSRSRPVIYIDMQRAGGEGASVLRRVCAAAGASPAPSPDAAIRSLLRRIADAKAAHGRSALLAIDGLTGADDVIEDIGLLARGAAATRGYSMLLVGLPNTIDRIAKSFPSSSGPTHTVSIPALDGMQTLSYLTAWLKACQGPETPPVIVTPDAALLVGYWSGGVFGDINRIATNMLQIAASLEKRIVTSWEAWSGASLLSDDTELDDHLRRPPTGWPVPDAERIIAECRERSGMHPRLRVQADYVHGAEAAEDG
ncbi:MAG: protein kinase [Deltaproteobacteria bacterium]|nr:protein kinase [Deltaproteobacteria bacterium]